MIYGASVRSRFGCKGVRAVLPRRRLEATVLVPLPLACHFVGAPKLFDDKICSAWDCFGQYTRSFCNPSGSVLGVWGTLWIQISLIVASLLFKYSPVAALPPLSDPDVNSIDHLYVDNVLAGDRTPPSGPAPPLIQISLAAAEGRNAAPHCLKWHPPEIMHFDITSV